ncbi:hypothetical protein Y032_0706g1690 [Ancylostoma ceylanicum]|uniref:Uncharacterized protein n=1 Tax=Ancylostoma ceylanicum TaxID=53326 RepID=A0A016WG91_9BILA|nr:hypothetical protein Y032_0706g1690 [Ancylostoma ceylanicum]
MSPFARKILILVKIQPLEDTHPLNICKVRSFPERTGTLTKLTRHASFSNLAEQKKQYKYFAHLLIPNVREINRLKLFRYEGSVDDRLEPTDVLPIFGWTIRAISSDVNWYVEAADKDVMVDFIEEVHKKIFMDFGRDTTWEGFTITEVPSNNLRDLLKKHIKRALSKEHDAPENSEVRMSESSMSPSTASSTFGFRSALGLRRTVSHVGSSFVRLAIPFSFRSHRTTSSAANESTDASLLSVSAAPNLPSQVETEKTAVSKKNPMVTVAEEPERCIAEEGSDKEN